jgi:hypothetical protein
MPIGSSDAPRDPTAAPVVPERRNGVVLGVAGGAAAAGSEGFTNNPRFLGNPDYFSSSPLLYGWSASFFMMGALADYVSFGPTFSIATFENDKWKSTGWGFGVRGEVYPLVKLVPALADTSVFAQLGVGSTTLRAKGPYPEAGATQSFLGLGIHHEWRLAQMLGGHASAGPFVEYDVIRADSVERHWATLGLRVVWYGGSVKLDGPTR